MDRKLVSSDEFYALSEIAQRFREAMETVDVELTERQSLIANPENIALAAIFSKKLTEVTYKLLLLLPKTENKVIRDFYGFDGRRDVPEIADAYSMTKDQVNETRAKALAILRDYFKNKSTSKPIIIR